MPNDVKLDIVLTDDGETAGAPTPKGEDKQTSSSGSVWMERLKTGAETFSKTAQVTAKILQPAAENNMMLVFQQSVSIASSALAMLGPTGAAAGAALSAVATGVQAFGNVIDSFIKRGEQLAQYSPEIAQSQAKREIANELADMQEAESLGPGIARLMDAQNDISNILREALLPIKKYIVDTLAPILEFLADQIRNGVILINDVATILKNIPDAIYQIVTLSSSGFNDVTERISREMDETRKTFDKNNRKDFEPITRVNSIIDELAKQIINPINPVNDPIIGG